MASTSAAAAGPPQVVMVKRELLSACLLCPLCHKLLRDATTISECLHTFCRKCIYKKLTDEEVDCCPICNIDLGVVPLEKLRPDHSLQDVRSKIFPFKRRKVDGSEAVPPITLPVRRKERSLSSLVVNTPRVSAQTGLTGRRTKPGIRRASTLRGLATAINDSIKKEDDNVDKFAETLSSADNSGRLAPNRKSSSNAEPSNVASNKDTDDSGETYLDKTELWKPLNTLVEAANRTKSFRSSSQNPVKAEQTNGTDNEGNVKKTRVKEYPHKSKVLYEKNDSVQAPPVTAKARRAQGASQKRGLATSAQDLLGAANAQYDRRITPIWFSLVASFEQAGDPPLSQIPTNYLRIKDGNVTASFIQKYLAMKLALGNEAEVEITCRGKPVSPTMTLHSLVEQWSKGGSSRKLQAAIGTSAKEFVTVLSYGRSKFSAQ